MRSVVKQRIKVAVAVFTALSILAVIGEKASGPNVLGVDLERAGDPGTVGHTAGFAQTSWMLLWGSDDEVNRDLDVIQATGAKWLRVDFDWKSAEPKPGVYQWTFLDRVVQRASSRGLRILATPAYTPQWARPAGTSDKYAPADPGAYAAFVKAAAQRYAPRGVHHWEIWNEPNVVQFWEPKPNPTQYAAMLKASSAAIRSVDSKAVVVTAGLAPAADTTDGRYVSPRTFLSKLYQSGARDSFDAVGIHPYAWPYGIAAPGDWNQWHSLPKTYDIMQVNGDGAKKIWATEYGAPTGLNSRAVSDVDQARFVKEAFTEWKSKPWAGPIFWYSLRDTGTDRNDLEQNFGVMRQDFSAKPALSEFKWAMAEETSSVAAPAPSPAPVPTPTPVPAVASAPVPYQGEATPAAGADWQSLGGLVTSNAAVVSRGTNGLDVFVRGGDNALWQRSWNGSSWSGWQSLGGHVTSDAAVVSRGTNGLDVFVRGGDNALWQRSWNGSSWSGWQSLGGHVTSNPTAVSWAADRVDVFVRGSDNALWHQAGNGSAWFGWQSRGGHVTSDPTALSRGANRLDMFVRGSDNALWHQAWNGSSWSAWRSLGGYVTSNPTAVSWAADRLDVFVRGSDNALWHQAGNGSAWFGWQSRGGHVTSDPAALSRGANRLDMFVRGGDNALWHQAWNGSSWSAWRSLGGYVTSDPAAVAAEPDRIDVFGRGGESALWQRRTPPIP